MRFLLLKFSTAICNMKPLFFNHTDIQVFPCGPAVDLVDLSCLICTSPVRTLPQVGLLQSLQRRAVELAPSESGKVLVTGNRDQFGLTSAEECSGRVFSDSGNGQDCWRARVEEWAGTWGDEEAE